MSVLLFRKNSFDVYARGDCISNVSGLTIASWLFVDRQLFRHHFRRLLQFYIHSNDLREW